MSADDVETDVNESTYYVDRFLVEKNEAEKAKLDTLAASTNSVVCQLSKDVKELALSSKSSLSELSSGMAALCEKGNMKLSRESSRLVRTSGSATGAISAPETPPERNVRQVIPQDPTPHAHMIIVQDDTTFLSQHPSYDA